jgi:hypothetical protein
LPPLAVGTPTFSPTPNLGDDCAFTFVEKNKATAATADAKNIVDFFILFLTFKIHN